MTTKTFWFNSGVRPWNTDAEWQMQKGNKFVNNELHHPYIVKGDIPDNVRPVCLMDDPFPHYSQEHFIIAEVVGGNMASKYAVFRKP